jgi:hypothetical protein
MISSPLIDHSGTFQPAEHLAERLIRRLPIENPINWKETAQKIIHLYCSQTGIVIEEGAVLKQLEEELKTHSISEIFSKYKYLISNKKTLFKDPLFIRLLNLLASEMGAALRKIEEMNLEERLQEQLDWKPVYRDELLRLMIDLKQKKAADRKNYFNCYVVEHHDLNEWLENYQNKGNSPHFQLIVRNDVHYTAMDCHIYPDSKSCLILDASQDPKHLILKNLMEEKGYDTLTAGASEEDKLQLDNRSCALFSLSQASRAAKDPDIFKRIKMHELYDFNEKRIPWIALAPSFVKDSQDLSFINNYFKKYPGLNNWPYKRNLFFNDYMKIKIKNDRIITTEINTGIESKINKYRSYIEDLFKSRPLENLNAIATMHPFQAINQNFEFT